MINKKIILLISLITLLLFSTSCSQGIVEPYDGQTDFDGSWTLTTIGGKDVSEYSIFITSFTSENVGGKSKTSPSMLWHIDGNEVSVIENFGSSNTYNTKINYTDTAFNMLSEDLREIIKVVDKREIDGKTCLVYNARYFNEGVHEFVLEKN